MEKTGMVGTGAMGLALLERLKLAVAATTEFDHDPIIPQPGRAAARVVNANAPK